jgi:hypothetical protein
MHLVFIVLLFALSAVHAEQVPLVIGGTTIQFPVDAGYVRVSQAEPKLFALTAAPLPPSNRLVEEFATSADIARIEQGAASADTYFQVQVMRSIESRAISIDDWNSARPDLTAGMTKLDMNKAVASNSGMNDRMSAAAGQKVNMNFDKLAAPAIYRETPQSVSFGMLVPGEMNVGGNVQKFTISAAGADVFVGNKLIFVYAYNSSTAPDEIAKLHARLDAVVDRAIALNPSDASVKSTGSFDWSNVGTSAIVGGILGALGGLVGWFVKRRKAQPPKT